MCSWIPSKQIFLMKLFHQGSLYPSKRQNGSVLSTPLYGCYREVMLHVWPAGFILSGRGHSKAVDLALLGECFLGHCVLQLLNSRLSQLECSPHFFCNTQHETSLLDHIAIGTAVTRGALRVIGINYFPFKVQNSVTESYKNQRFYSHTVHYQCKIHIL